MYVCDKLSATKKFKKITTQLLILPWLLLNKRYEVINHKRYIFVQY